MACSMPVHKQVKWINTSVYSIVRHIKRILTIVISFHGVELSGTASLLELRKAPLPSKTANTNASIRCNLCELYYTADVDGPVEQSSDQSVSDTF